MRVQKRQPHNNSGTPKKGLIKKPFLGEYVPLLRRSFHYGPLIPNLLHLLRSSREKFHRSNSNSRNKSSSNSRSNPLGVWVQPNSLYVSPNPYQKPVPIILEWKPRRRQEPPGAGLVCIIRRLGQSTNLIKRIVLQKAFSIYFCVWVFPSPDLNEAIVRISFTLVSSAHTRHRHGEYVEIRRLSMPHWSGEIINGNNVHVMGRKPNS